MNACDTDAAVQQTLSHWAAAEEKYRANLYGGGGAAGSVRLVGDPSNGLLFTAPHAVNHVRNGATKVAELGTGGLAESLAQMLRAAALTVDGPLHDDPSWEPSVAGAFKQALLPLINSSTLILDLHGMRDDHEVDVCVGLGPYAAGHSLEICHKLRHAFDARGLRVSINWPFNAVRAGTITWFVQKHGGMALQVELAARVRKLIDKAAVQLLLGFKSALERV